MTAVGHDRAVAFPFARERAIAVGLTVIAMTVMLWPHLGYVPLWDGRVYANCVMDAAYTGLSIESLRCAGHPSQGWALVLALPQLVDPGNIVLFNATNLLLGAIALVAIRIVLARTFPRPEHARHLDVVAAACALHPVVLSTLLQPNVDFGVYVFFFVALAGLLTPSRGGTLVAVAGGTLLAFSKETGVAAYGLALAAALAIEQAHSGVPFRTRMRTDARAMVRRAAVLSLPLVLFVAHVLQWNATHPQGAIWKHGWQESSADGFRFFDLSDSVFVSYAAGLFVLGFMWVAWFPVAVDGAAGIVRMARRAPARRVEGADHTVLVTLTVLTFAITYLFTSFRTWSNLRYFAVLYPLFLLLSYAALVRLGLPARIRGLAVGAVLALFVLAGVRSVDPLSRAVYGTFDTGVRRMYWMTSIAKEFEGPGRDQIVYNLEFAGYHHVQNALYARLKPNDSTVIGTPRHVRWNVWSQLDKQTAERSMRRGGVFTPTYADEVDIAARRSREAWFLDFSNHGAKDRALQTLLPQYQVVDSLVVVAGGQRVTARHLVRREASVLP